MANSGSGNSGTAAGTIKEQALRDLIVSQAVQRLIAIGKPGGFSLSIGVGTTMLYLANARGEIRLFASLDTIALLLQRLGHVQFEVEAGDFTSSKAPRMPRPKKAAQVVGEEF